MPPADGLDWPELSVLALALAVDEENDAGRRADAAAGFVYCADPRPGRIGLIRTLAKWLCQSPATVNRPETDP